ncbi:MAG: rhodanese-like domain-containing protein [Acidobacteriia bacterium]|nr:rhodanese-like domain-containing protein [Terriglobia bacterium]
MPCLRGLGTAFLLTMFAATGLKAADSANPWTRSDLVTAAQLNSQLPAVKAGKVILIHVGFRVLYNQGHIPGSQYAGPGVKPEGLVALRKLVEKLPRSPEIVIYCGCCPSEECPNIRPAFRALRQMGFSNLKVLDIPLGLETDWAAKGYPLTREE